MAEFGVDVIEKIIELSEPHMQTIGEIEYSDKKLYQISENHIAEPIETGTLSSVVSYIKEFSEKDSINASNYMIHIESPECVSILSNFTADRKREKVLKACAKGPRFEYNTFYEQEAFIISVKSMFVDDPKTDKSLVLQFAGTVTTGTVREYGDDGISQKAQIKTGIAQRQDALVPSPCNLRPYRTFIEVEQPASEFIFRMRDGRNGVESALFAADGDMWKIKAMCEIKTWLETALGEDNDVTIIM